MDLRNTQIKDTYGNILTTGSVAGAPTIGTLQNGQGTNVTALTLDGDLTVDNVNATVLTGTLSTAAQASVTSVGTLTGLSVNGTTALQGAVTINDAGDNVDFRVEGDTDANLLFVDASADRVGIGTSSPTNLLTVAGNANITGNTTLGDASTDTVRVNGVMGIGTPPVSYRSLQIASSGLTGNINVLAVDINSSIASDVTNTFSALRTLPATAAASFTVGQVTGVSVANASKGAGSTISTLVGIEIADQTQGNFNRGLVSAVSSGANKWNIYASGTANNYFNGDVGIGTSSPSAKLHVSGGNIKVDDTYGIDFSATSGTGTSELFDDYEEGTWTATLISGATTTPTSTSVGYYTKVGRVVHVMLTSTFGSITVNGTAIAISGLPFTSGYTNVVGNIGVTARAQYQSSATHCWQIESGTQLHAVYMSANTGSPVDLLSEASGTYTPTFYVNITYTV